MKRILNTSQLRNVSAEKVDFELSHLIRARVRCTSAVKSLKEAPVCVHLVERFGAVYKSLLKRFHLSN